MADEFQSPHTIRAVNWRELFPFLHLFRAFRVAVHPSKLALALAALILIYSGGRILDAAWPQKYQPVLIERDALAHRVTPVDYDVLTSTHVGVFDTFFNAEIVRAERTMSAAMALQPAASIDAIGDFLVVLPGWLWMNHWLFALIFTAWFLLVWSVFGGAIARIAAVHVARDEKISVRQAGRFSVNKVLSFIFAPLIPLLIIFGIGICLSAAGWVLFHLSHPGAIIAGALWILALLGGLIMALVLLGTLGGINLMYPTIAVEGSDSFDAISRSFSYVFARPWRMLWYTAVTLVYGGICYLFVRFFIFLILALTRFFVGWWLTSRQVGPAYEWMFPSFGPDQLSYSPAYAHLIWPEDLAATLIAIWNYLVISMLGAFAISFYFSSSTIMYYLMRREVDATELEDVYVEESDDDLSDVGPAVSPAGAFPVTPAVPAGTVPAASDSLNSPTSLPETSTFRATGMGETAPATPAGTEGSMNTGAAAASTEGVSNEGGSPVYTDTPVENPPQDVRPDGGENIPPAT